MQDITLIAQSIVAAAIFSFLFYVKNRQKKGEPFKPEKAAPTIIVGIAVGVGYALSGVAPTEEMIIMQLSTMGGVIMAVQLLLQSVVNSLPGPSTSGSQL